MAVEGVSQESNGYTGLRQFLYADYSPFDDDRNVIEMLKDFVSLTGRLIKLQTDNEKLASTLHAAQALLQDAKQATNQLRTGATSVIDWFHNKHPDALVTEFHTASAALVDNARKTISDILAATDTGFDEQHGKYVDKIMSEIRDNHLAAATLMQSWLSRDYKNFTTSLLSSLSTEMTLTTNTENFKTYTVYLETSSTKPKTRNGRQGREKNARSLNYKFRIDTSDLEFWQGVRKISEFGPKDLMLPIGMEAPISEKLKKALSFGSRNNELIKEPKFVKVDEYYLLAGRLEGGETLSIQLVPDITKADVGLIEIFYDLPYPAGSNSKPEDSDDLPEATNTKINYRSRENGHFVEVTDVLRIKQIAEASDLAKISFLGTSILDKLRILENTSLTDSRGKLESLKVDDNHILLSEGTAKVEFTLLFELLNSVAATFTPFVKSLKEKTPVRGELILREQVEEGQRREFNVRLDDLRSQLSLNHYCGKMISDTLQL